MTALLPEGRFVQEPDAAKLVKVVPGPNGHIVIVKLEDDSEIMVKTCDNAQAAYAFADRCTNALNGDEDPHSEEDSPISEVRPSERSSSQTDTLNQNPSSRAAAKDSDNANKSSFSVRTSSVDSSKVPDNDQDLDSEWSDDQGVKITNASEENSNHLQVPSDVMEEEEPLEFPSFGTALENSLEDSDEWPIDNGLDDWFD